MQKEHKTVIFTLLAIVYLLFSVWLAMMAGPIYGTVLFIGLLLLLTVIVVFALRKLK